MRDIRNLFALGMLVVLTTTPGAYGDEVGEETLDEIEACMSANLPKSTSVQEVEVESVDRLGNKATTDAKVYWKRFEDGLSKALVRVTAPPNVRGTAILILEREGQSPDIFNYLPELQRVRRITQHHVSGSFLGTDFTYEDIERLQGLATDANRKRLPDTELNERPVWVLEGRPGRGEDSSYEVVRSYVDQLTCVTLRTELYEKQDDLAKILLADPTRIERHDERNIPFLIRAEDKKLGTSSELQVESIEMGKDIPRKYFSERALQVRN